MNLPTSSGLGLKPEHFRDVLEARPNVGFFEVHAENYMVDGGPMHHYLGQIRASYALSLHGVGLSIGSEQPPDEAHLDRLALLIKRYQPACFSEHLAWSSHGNNFYNDLLPLPYDPPTLQRVSEHIDRIQTRLGQPILLENPSTYVEFERSTMSEGDFIGSIVERTGCGLLLDVNNVYVSCINHNRDPWEAIEALPLHATRQIHLAGFARDSNATDVPLLIDSHGAPVDAEVWALYQRTVERLGATPTLIERDADIPSLRALQAEARLATDIMDSALEREA